MPGTSCKPECEAVCTTEVEADCRTAGVTDGRVCCVADNAKNGDELGNCSARWAGDKCTQLQDHGGGRGVQHPSPRRGLHTDHVRLFPDNAKNGDELGNCSASLPAGDKCTPSCKDGYTEVDAVCSITGVLTTAAACTQITCNASAVPDNAKNGDELGNCSASLPAGDKCTPSCKDGYTEVDAVCSITMVN